MARQSKVSAADASAFLVHNASSGIWPRASSSKDSTTSDKPEQRIQLFLERTLKERSEEKASLFDIRVTMWLVSLVFVFSVLSDACTSMTNNPSFGDAP